MVEQHVGQLESLIDALVSTGETPNSEGLGRVAQTLAKTFGVDPDEVAILALNSKAKNLKFVIPEKLAAAQEMVKSGNWQGGLKAYLDLSDQFPDRPIVLKRVVARKRLNPGSN